MDPGLTKGVPSSHSGKRTSFSREGHGWGLPESTSRPLRSRGGYRGPLVTDSHCSQVPPPPTALLPSFLSPIPRPTSALEIGSLGRMGERSAKEQLGHDSA